MINFPKLVNFFFYFQFTMNAIQDTITYFINDSWLQTLASLSAQMLFYFFSSWLYILNVLTYSCHSANVFSNALREKCSNGQFFLVSEYRKIRTRKNSFFGHFSRCDAVLVFHNLFWGICRLFGQLFITCLKCSKASFLSSS